MADRRDLEKWSPVFGQDRAPDEIVDARGLKCPLPVLRMEKRLASLQAGAMVIVLATDPVAKIDIPLFCTQNGHECEMVVDGEVMRFRIVKNSQSGLPPP